MQPGAAAMPSLLKLLTARPELLAARLGEYAALAAAEAEQAAEALRVRALLGSVMVMASTLALGLAGVALLLLAALPLAAMPRPWLLAVVPLVPLGLSAGCWLALRHRPPMTRFAGLRERLASDAAALTAPSDVLPAFPGALRSLLMASRRSLRRSPLLTLLLAAVGGAALVSARPWRWTWLKRSLSPLAAELGPWLMQQAMQPAVQSMMAAWLLKVIAAMQVPPTASPPAGAAPAPSAGPDTAQPPAPAR